MSFCIILSTRNSAKLNLHESLKNKLIFASMSNVCNNAGEPMVHLPILVVYTVMYYYVHVVVSIDVLRQYKIYILGSQGTFSSSSLVFDQHAY